MLQCMFISTVTLLHLSEQTCLDVEYLSENGICCNKCFQGNVWTTSQSHVHWLCHTSCYTNCKNSFSEVKFYGDPPPPTFDFQVLSLQRSAPLRVREVNASPVSPDNTEIQLTTLAPAESAKSAKVQYSGLYTIKSDSPVCFVVVQSAAFLCSFRFPRHQRTMWRLRNVTGRGTPFAAARMVITSLTSIQKHTNASNAKPVN